MIARCTAYGKREGELLTRRGLGMVECNPNRSVEETLPFFSSSFLRVNANPRLFEGLCDDEVRGTLSFAFSISGCLH